jgi:hypothetical protein
MEKYAGGTPGRDLTYYQNVHQDLAPLARQLERELDRTKAELTELRVQMARSAGDAVPAEQKQADESNVAPASQHGMDFGVDADAERALFETWARDPVRSEKLPLDRWPTNDGYKDSRTYIAFYGWKARAKVDSGFREGRNTNDSNSEVAAPTNTAPAVQPEPVEGKKRADFLTWWTSIEIDVRKSMLVFASRDRERLLALVRMAYEQGQDSANESAEGAKP